MTNSSLPEFWLRGPISGLPPLLQPVAHALLQANEEVRNIMDNFPVVLLWIKPAGMASTGFHLNHLAGVLDRLFTYAEGNSLTIQQLEQLKNEGNGPVDVHAVQLLTDKFKERVEKCIQQLKVTNESCLTETRYVGRAQIPSTVIGLLFHAAEHTMRHVGQLVVTVRVVKANASNMITMKQD